MSWNIKRMFALLQSEIRSHLADNFSSHPMNPRTLSGLVRSIEVSVRQARLLGRVHCPQELHELLTDHLRRFVLYPMAYVVELEPSPEPRKPGAHLVYSKRIKLFHSIRLPPNEKGRLCDLRTFESCGKIEIRFCGAVVVQPP